MNPDGKTKNDKIYTEEELHEPPKKHKATDNCLTFIINWFLKICNFKKKRKEEPNKIEIK